MVLKQKKKLIKSTKKEDAVRRCIKGYECKFTQERKLKHLVSKEAFKYRWVRKKSC